LEKAYSHSALLSNTCSLVHVNPVTPSGIRALIGLSRRTVSLVASDYGSLVCGDGLGVTPHFLYERSREKSLSNIYRYSYVLTEGKSIIFSTTHNSLNKHILIPTATSILSNTSSFPQRLQSKTSLFYCTKSYPASSDQLESIWPLGDAKAAVPSTDLLSTTAPGADTTKPRNGSR
jgi:hypothetical protein